MKFATHSTSPSNPLTPENRLRAIPFVGGAGRRTALVGLIVGVSLAIGCAAEDTSTNADNVASSSDASAPDTSSDARAKTKDAAPSPVDASETGSAAEALGNCGGAYACDPLLDTGCGVGEHCMVTELYKAGKTSYDVSCKTAGVGTALGTPKQTMDCLKEGCAAGHLCRDMSGYSLCVKMCDPTKGTTQLAAGWVGRGKSPDCPSNLAPTHPDCIGIPDHINAGPVRCFGYCDVLGKYL